MRGWGWVGGVLSFFQYKGGLWGGGGGTPPTNQNKKGEAPPPGGVWLLGGCEKGGPFKRDFVNCAMIGVGCFLFFFSILTCAVLWVPHTNKTKKPPQTGVVAGGVKGPLQSLPAFILSHAATPRGGQADGLLRKIHDDKAHAVVLPQERKKASLPQRILLL